MSGIGYLNPAWYIFGVRIFKIDNEKCSYIFITSTNKIVKNKNFENNIVKLTEYSFVDEVIIKGEHN
jgi:hypothetical protein